MRRRRFVTGLLGISALMLAPSGLRAQQPAQPKRAAVLMLYAEDDPEGQARARAFREGLESLGWHQGKTIVIDIVWGVFDADWTHKVTARLREFRPDVIVVNSSTGLPAIEEAARTTPVVFVAVSEPPPEPLLVTHRKRIVELATARKLPVVSAIRSIAEAGGLLAYGANIPDLFRQSADYVDRIFKGEKPADMPVQQPTKFEMIVNVRSARALDIAVPATILARADEVLE